MDDLSVTSKEQIAQLPDLAYRLLHLEQQLKAYEKLHAEELDELRRALTELKKQYVRAMSLKAEKDNPCRGQTFQSAPQGTGESGCSGASFPACQ